MTRIDDAVETIQYYIDEPHLYADGYLAITAARALDDGAPAARLAGTDRQECAGVGITE